MTSVGDPTPRRAPAANVEESKRSVTSLDSRAYLAIVVALVGAVGIGIFASRSSGDHPVDDGPHPGRRMFVSDDPLERGCRLPLPYVRRIWRGHHPVHSEDVTMVPLEPNTSGTFEVTSHSGPWDYLQNVPLVFYGPGYIQASGNPLHGAAGLADVFPTVAELVGVDLPHRDGRPIDILESDRPAPPKLILTVVWDGVGRNVLERWPTAWPHLAELERDGSSLLDAVVGSSPSITPATHSTLGTGTYPRRHGVTAIEYRTTEGIVRDAFAQRDPVDLKLKTFADEIDLALGNKPRVGMLAWKGWHLGMFSHGTQLRGGDADELGIITTDEHITGNPDFYSTPDYLRPFPGLQERLDEADRSDGKLDGDWRGHTVETHDNPGWVNYATDALLTMLDRGGYGDDEVPDLFFINFKMTDIAGHQYTMDSLEERDTLHAQDAALGRIIDFLEREVGEYVVILSADHGHTPAPDSTGAWPVYQSRLADDIDEHFGVEDGDSLIDKTTAVGPFLDYSVMDERGVTSDDIARFINGYRIKDNADGELPEGYEQRGSENVFAAAFPSDDIREILRCAIERAGRS